MAALVDVGVWFAIAERDVSRDDVARDIPLYVFTIVISETSDREGWKEKINTKNPPKSIVAISPIKR